MGAGHRASGPYNRQLLGVLYGPSLGIVKVCVYTGYGFSAGTAVRAGSAAPN
jgi:hypothetical protein